MARGRAGLRFGLAGRFRDGVVKLLDRPQPVSRADGHRGRHAKRLVTTHEVVVREVERYRRLVVSQFLAERVREARHAADLHPHGEVLALHVGRGGEGHVGVAHDDALLAGRDARCTVLALRVLALVLRVGLDDLGVVHVLGEDRRALGREIARRFNHLYGKEKGFEEKALEAVKKLGSKRAKMYAELRVAFQERGDDEALEQAKALLQEAQSLSMADRERLFGFLEGSRKIILPEPQALLTTASRMPGIDGQKMSKSYGNTISIRENPEDVTKKIRTMPTDPARVRRTDAGDPARCPVWQLHTVYSNEETKRWVEQGCKSAGIGCLECKQPVIDAILAEQQPMFERAQKYLDDPSLLRSIIADGCDKARKVAQETMREVREAMGLAYD